jgi:glutaredoxin-like protein NrdH
MITVYTKPACVQCKATYRELEKLHLEYQSIDLTQDDEAMALVASLGYSSAPVVVVDENEHWSGFRPDRVAALVHA